MTAIQAFVASLENRAPILLASVAIWATIVLGAAWFAAARLRGASPAVRYCVWQFALTGLLIVPLVFAVLPGVPLGLALPAMQRTAEAAAPPRRPDTARVADWRHSRVTREEQAARAGAADFGQPPLEPVLARHAADSRKAAVWKSVAPATIPQPMIAKTTAAVAPAVRSAPTWPALVLRLWLIGAAIQAIWLIISATIAWKLARQAQPLNDQRFQRSLDDLRQRLALRRNPRLSISDRVCLPVVVGAWFPKILLPADCRRWTHERIRMVLAHELAHVERRDVFWQLMGRTAAVVYWFHPLVWLAVRRMRQERERACDDQVLQVGVEAADYAAGLVEVAAAVGGRRLQIPVAVGMAHRSHLENRIRSILDCSRNRDPASAQIRRGMLLATAAVVLTLGLLRPFSPIRSGAAETASSDNPQAINTPATVQNTAPQSGSKSVGANAAAQTPAADKLDVDKNGNQLTTGKIRVSVLDEAGQPLNGVQISTNAIITRDFDGTNVQKTVTANGTADLELPPRLSLLQLRFSKPGYVFQSHTWNDDGYKDGTRVPGQYTIRMQRGTVVGGIVVDEENKPVAGAVVKVTSYALEAGAIFSWWPADGELKTDAHGRWKLDTVPPGNHPRTYVSAAHPEFISLDEGNQQPIEKLRAQMAITVMRRGIRIGGTVTTPDGKPFVGALAIWGEDPKIQRYPNQVVHTDSRGAYRLPPLPSGSIALTIIAEGWMPEMRTIRVTKENPPVDFRLKPGNTLRISLVDKFGKPVTHARFDIMQWRGTKALFRVDSDGIRSGVPIYPNKQGIYQWTWAPADPIRYLISAVGDFSAPETDFTADNKEHVFVLQPKLRITGSVSDAATGRPIEKFTTMPVDELGENSFYAERRDAQRQRGGKYALAAQDRNVDWAYRARIEADGYRSAMSGAFHIGDSNTTWDFRLHPAPALRGRVLSAGQPRSGAKVFLATRTQPIDRWVGYENASSENYCRTKTGAHGVFTFPAQFETYRLIAIADDGYADITRAGDQQPGDLSLEKWARVDGRLFQAGKPVSGGEVHLVAIDGPKSDGSPSIGDIQYTHTDDAGSFEFDRVPPRKYLVWTCITPWHPSDPITSSQHVPLDLKPGQHVMLNLGGDGIQATGRVALTGPAAKGVDARWSLNHLLRMRPGIEPSADVRRLGFDWRKGWNRAWDDTAEAKEYLDTLYFDSVLLTSDGHFSINGLSAGDYQLALRIYKHDDPQACLVDPIAERVVKFTVTPADVAKNHLDLGTIEIEAATVPQSGEIVPDFEFATLAGPTKKLSDFRGKIVMLDFWATWCRDCVASLPAVHQLAEKYGGDGRLVVVPISLDADQNALRQFVAERKLGGVQGLLGDWSKTQMPMRLGVSSLPAYLLIGPDGKLIVNSWSVDKIAEKLPKILKSPAAVAK